MAEPFVKISDRTLELAADTQKVRGAKFTAIEPGHILQAIDEWAAAVDDRLRSLTEVVNEIQIRRVADGPSKYEPEIEPEPE